MMDRRTFLVSSLVTAFALALQRRAFAQAWPAKPIRLIVPFPPGGGTDVVSRTLGDRLGAALGVPIVVENRPGAGGNLGLDAVAKSAPDGYTVGMGQTSNLAINPTLYSSLPFNPQKDFAPIALVASQAMVLIVAKDAPFRTLGDVVAGAKAKGDLTMASAGNGTVGHLAGEMFARRAGIKLVHVPYKGAAPALTDVMGGSVAIFFASAGAVTGQVEGGRVRALAVTSAERMKKLPDVPTIAEAGYPGFEATDWKALVAPAGTPATIVSRLNAEVARALQSREMSERLASEGSEPMGGSPARFAQFLRDEGAKWSAIVKASGAKVD
jgi:tripartite-type tricarboxylate transporter receptor subunit TctC